MPFTMLDRPPLIASLFTLLLAASAAAQDKPATRPAADGRSVVHGVVSDAAGKPLAGAVVIADATLFYNTNLEARSDKDGKYRIELPAGGAQTTWRATASVGRKYNGKAYKFELHPDDDAAFAGTDGAERNFKWLLSGEKPDGRGAYGSHVVAYTPLMSDLAPADVALTLTPDGPLVDGSVGKPVTGTLQSTPEGWALSDVPVGRYKVTAVEAKEGGGGGPLLVRWRGKGEFGPSLVADFELPYGASLAIARMDLEVKRP